MRERGTGQRRRARHAAPSRLRWPAPSHSSSVPAPTKSSIEEDKCEEDKCEDKCEEEKCEEEECAEDQYRGYQPLPS